MSPSVRVALWGTRCRELRWLILGAGFQRERERRNSDKSEDGYHSDGDYGEHDYRNDINDEKESKTIMLRGLPITVTENDVSRRARLCLPCLRAGPCRSGCCHFVERCIMVAPLQRCGAAILSPESI